MYCDVWVFQGRKVKHTLLATLDWCQWMGQLLTSVCVVFRDVRDKQKLSQVCSLCLVLSWPATRRPLPSTAASVVQFSHVSCNNCRRRCIVMSQLSTQTVTLMTATLPSHVVTLACHDCQRWVTGERCHGWWSHNSHHPCWQSWTVKVACLALSVCLSAASLKNKW